jgi:hypothetical protein
MQDLLRIDTDPSASPCEPVPVDRQVQAGQRR